MIIRETPLAGAYVIEQERDYDDQGFSARTWCKDKFLAYGMSVDFLQCSTSFSLLPGTVRGLHFQSMPFGETNLVRCVRGAIHAVIVDLRVDSSTYGRWFGTELNEDSGAALYVPKDFAHGFQTLRPKSEVSYMSSIAHIADAERGIAYNDPDLNILWPLPVRMLSARDARWPLMKEQKFNIERLRHAYAIAQHRPTSTRNQANDNYH